MKTEQTAQRNRPKASTAQILGSLNGQKKINPKWRDAYDSLLELRESLLHSKTELVESTRQEQQSAFSLHMADAATDQYDLDFSLGMISSEQNALYEVEEALNRIRNGSYGVCEITGAEIEAERLKAIPWTRFSANAQRELELSGAVSKPRLGQLATIAQASAADESEEEGDE